MKLRNAINAGKIGSVTQSAATLGAMGAVMGGTVSAIGNTLKVINGEQDSTVAISNVAKDTLGSGISSATGAAAMAALGIGGLFGIAGFAAVATITKGILDSVLHCEKKQAEPDAQAQ
jgi:hypothetical protein